MTLVFSKGRKVLVASLRLGVWVVSMFMIAISGWVFAFVNSKGKQYRFSFIAPLIMLIFQLVIYVFDKRDSALNEFNIKVFLSFLVSLVIIVLYFIIKKKLRVDE